MEYSLLETARILQTSKGVIKYRATLLAEDEKIKQGDQWIINDKGLEHLRQILNKPAEQDPVQADQIIIDPIDPQETPETQKPAGNYEKKETGKPSETPDPRDETIRDLRDQNAQLTKLLDQQQQLHSQDINQYKNMLALKSGETDQYAYELEQLEQTNKARLIIIIALVVALIGLGAYFIWYIS